MQDLEKVAEYEHNVARRILTEGRQFYSHVEQQARGFSQAESQAARNNMDIELRRYRQADVVRQQRSLENCNVDWNRLIEKPWNNIDSQ
eukprot:376047-Amphidinium_carterae.1